MCCLIIHCDFSNTYVAVPLDAYMYISLLWLCISP